MPNHNHNTPTEYDFFTGGKLPELAIAYNLAVDNLDNYIKSILNNTDPKYKPTDHLDDLPDFVFPYLRHYMWKGNNENKNSAGYELTPGAKYIIKELIEKLKRLRNFHSHVWHTNEMMEFDNELVHFIMDRHDIACAKLIEENAKAVDTAIYFDQLHKFPLFDHFKNKDYIKPTGRVFFLSFFLNKGEMQSLMQSMQGYKRTNAPEFIFKHKVFTFYCHREGSSWDSTGVDNTELAQKDEDEQQRILNGRQAYRIFNYLKDIPAISKDKTLPLVLSNGSWVSDMNMLLDFISEKNLMPGYKFYKKDSAYTNDIVDEKKRNEAQKVVEQKERDGFRHFRKPGQEDYEFEISYGTLRHIATDIFLDDNDESLHENPSRNHFAEVLRLSIEYRQYIYDQLLNAGDGAVSFDTYKVIKKYSAIYINYDEYQDTISNEPYTANEWRHISISATPNTERLLVQWLAEFTKGTEEKPSKQEYNKRLKLLNAIRSAQVAFDKTPYEGRLKNGHEKELPKNIDPHPLLFHLNYYYREDEIKLRKKDYFIEWAIRYFVDSNLLPDAYFEEVIDKKEEQKQEHKTIYKLKRKTIWVKNPKQNFRFRIADNQVNIGIEKNGQIYRLRLGEKVIKYLLLFRENNKDDRSIQGFLESIAEDLAIVHSGTPGKINMASLQMLEVFSIPPVLFKTRITEVNEKGTTAVMYKEQVTKYLKANLNWINESLENQPKLNRNQKNAIILDAYRLFDFTKTQDAKFLRKNEYEQMSICHFMLNQNKQKVYDLIRKVFMLEYRLPREIKYILEKVIETKDYNLDHLFQLVLENRKEFFDKKLADTRKNYKQLQYLNIRLADNHLDDETLAARNQLRTDMLSHTPFAIHPALTLKYFYPEKFADGVFKKESDSHENLFFKLREEPQHKQWLSFGTLRTEPVQKILAGYLQAFVETQNIKEYQKAWTGIANDIKTKDILLLLVGKEYLKMYDASLSAEFEKLLTTGNKDFENLMKEEVMVSISYNEQMQETIVAEDTIGTIYLNLRMHQLDDYFFRNHKNRFLQLAMLYIQNHHEDLDLYKDNEKIYKQVNAQPDGTLEKPLTINNLLEARRENAQQAQELVQYIIDFEKLRIADFCGTADKNVRQSKLTAYSMKHNNAPYIAFKQSVNWNNKLNKTTIDTIKELRRKSLHNGIPLHGSFRKQAMPDSDVGKALNIQKSLGKDRTDFNPYDPESSK